VIGRRRRRELILPGIPQSAAAARAAVRKIAVTAAQREAAELAVSEFIANALLHSRSGQPGGTVTLIVIATRRRLRIEVRDSGTYRCHQSGQQDAEHGRGLPIVAAVAASFGNVAWCEVAA
jgi:anti-sigma regulatory factor (Ser/Thr protein kinase)